MNLKLRLSLLFVGTYLLIFSVILSSIYISNARFRREEFYKRLEQRSLTTANLLLEVAEVNKNLLKIIERNSIGSLPNEKIGVYGSSNELVYCSVDESEMDYSPLLLDKFRKEKRTQFTHGADDEALALHYPKQSQDYLIVASAYDKYGKRKLQFLLQVIIISLLFGMLISFGASYLFIREVFKPIDRLNHSIQTITEQNLNQLLPVKNSQDELDRLARNFNQMLGRLRDAFDLQKTFVQNASHELKTPLARMSSRVEKAISLLPDLHSELGETLQHSLTDIKNQADLIESLLLLHRLQSPNPINRLKVRIDELLFEVAEEKKSQFPDFRILIDFDSSIHDEYQLTVWGNPLLFKTCFSNLLRNAILYSTKKEVEVTFSGKDLKTQITFRNEGQKALDKKTTFEPFQRGDNTMGKSGHGLGLSIVKKIVELFDGEVRYDFDGSHNFRIILSEVVEDSGTA